MLTMVNSCKLEEHELAETYSSTEQNAILAIIRICQRSKGWRDDLKTITDLDKVKTKNSKFWKILLKTPNKEAAWLIIKMVKTYLNKTEEEWCALRDNDLEDYVCNFALTYINDIIPVPEGQPKIPLSQELLELLALGLGPWPKGDGDW